MPELTVRGHPAGAGGWGLGSNGTVNSVKARRTPRSTRNGRRRDIRGRVFLRRHPTMAILAPMSRGALKKRKLLYAKAAWLVKSGGGRA
jgi:hypothetical protein